MKNFDKVRMGFKFVTMSFLIFLILESWRINRLQDLKIEEIKMRLKLKELESRIEK